jgi:predicted esterase
VLTTGGVRSVWQATLPLKRSLIGLAVLGAAAVPPVTAYGAPERTPRWCAPELATVEHDACFFAAEADEAAPGRVLVVFLHSLVKSETDWQWQQQRALVRAARRHGFSALMSRGRLGIGPGRKEDVWAWPTARETQERVEAELIDEWKQARAAAERRAGPYTSWFVMGFSNGAYYAASLAMRSRVDADGFGIFAGGSAGRGTESRARGVTSRPPIFVGYGAKDASRRDPQGLAAVLAKVGWPHALHASRAGHTVTDEQLDRAYAFLSEHAAVASAPTPDRR